MKKNIILFFALIIVIIGSVFIMYHEKSTTFQKAVLDGKDKVYKISIHRNANDGSIDTGLFIEDEEMINEIMGKFSQMELKKENVKQSIGKYSITIYYNTGCCHTNMVTTKDGGYITINGKGYKIVNNINLVKLIDNENLNWDVTE